MTFWRTARAVPPAASAIPRRVRPDTSRSEGIAHRASSRCHLLGHRVLVIVHGALYQVVGDQVRVRPLPEHPQDPLAVLLPQRYLGHLAHQTTIEDETRHEVDPLFRQPLHGPATPV